MTNAVDTFVDKLLIGLQPNEKQCAEWLDRSVGIVTALLPYIGYENSAMIAKEAYNTGKPVREVILEKGLISKEKMEKMEKIMEIITAKSVTGPDIRDFLHFVDMTTIPLSEIRL